MRHDIVEGIRFLRNLQDALRFELDVTQTQFANNRLTVGNLPGRKVHADELRLRVIHGHGYQIAPAGAAHFQQPAAVR